MTDPKPYKRPSDEELRKTHTGEKIKPTTERYGLSGQTSIPTQAQSQAAYQLEQRAMALNGTGGFGLPFNPNNYA